MRYLSPIWGDGRRIRRIWRPVTLRLTGEVSLDDIAVQTAEADLGSNDVNGLKMVLHHAWQGRPIA